MRTLMKTCGLGLAVFAAACGAPEEQDDVGEPVDPTVASAIEGSLTQFESNPRDFLNRIPPKLNSDGVAIFDRTTIDNLGYLTAKDLDRDGKMDAPGYNDQARDLVDQGASLMTNLASMGSAGLKSGSLKESAWSDDYWAIFSGGISKRYADPGYKESTDWKANTDYVRNSQPVNKDDLSPAEKYDLLVGDASKTLTKKFLDAGQYYYDSNNKKVETWMGHCHGWAPAAYMVDRPAKTIEVTAADGTTKVKFYPSDIKALATALWAQTRFPTRFVGGRCNVKDPAKDSIGRIKDQACRDTNAGTWHMAVVNQVGRAKRGFVLDATFDYEVWNQPVYSYQYYYFNPRTNKTSSSLSGARVAVSSFPEDKFKAYRAPGTTHIVGVAMDVKWTVETRPSHVTTDSASRDAISGARYLYTLELDASGNIIGGEWLSNAHPDFLWTPPPGVKPTTVGESLVGSATWDGASKLPDSWKSAGQQSARAGQPLASIVYKLVEASRK
jgi:hypothetical protein